MAMRMANWQIRVILPALLECEDRAEEPDPRRELVIAEMRALAHVRGMRALAFADARNDEGPPEEGPSRDATTAAEE